MSAGAESNQGRDGEAAKPIRERYLLQSAPLIKALGNVQPKKTEWLCLTKFMEVQNCVSKAVTRISRSKNKITSSVVCRKCNAAVHKAVDCTKKIENRANNLPGGQTPHI